jgi:hypothetical protein
VTDDDVSNPQMTRGEFRQLVAEALYASGAARQERRADIVMGLPGAGKTTTTTAPLAREHGSIIIDPELAMPLIPEYAGGNGAGVVHRECSDIVGGLVLPRALTAGDNVVIEIVGVSGGYVSDLVDALAALDYSVHVHLVELPPDEAARRAWARYLEGGPFIDPDYVRVLGGLIPVSGNYRVPTQDVNEYVEQCAVRGAQSALAERLR